MGSSASTSGEIETSDARVELVMDAVAAVAHRDPDRIALAFEDQTLSYGELLARADRVAARLVDAGAGPDRIVGVIAEPGFEVIVAILAVLRSGAGYLALDSSYPAARVKRMLEISGAFAILRCGSSGLSRDPFWSENGRLVFDVGEHQDGTSSPTPFRAAHVAPENIAYLVFTSGSTGTPKAVMISHAGLLPMLRAQIELFQLRETSRVLQFASLSFDASVSEVFTTLVAGARLSLAPRAALTLGEPLRRTMREHRITMVTLPPSILAELPDDGLPHLETVVSAGEACSAAVVARWASERRFLNAYGPSEVTVCATAAVCEPDGLAPLIGSALAHVRVSVLDDQLALVGAGKAGELCIAGDALARGYLGMPAHTAIAFVPDHHAERPGQRMYRTGDLVEIDPSGALRYVTRADQQVKIRGYRIELGEIEHELRDEFGVRDAHVFDATDPHGDRHLVAYVIPATLDGDELRARLRARLPEFMVPARVIGVDHWPLSPNGKIDRAALPSADHVLAVDGRTYTAPRDATELALVKIWEDVLGRAPIGIDDDFFALGGHSLLALRVTAKARDVLGLTSTIETIAEYPTIASFAHHVRSSAYHPGSRTGSCVLQSGQRQSPLFFVPPIHGSPLCYVPVARMLGDAWTCIGLLAPGLAGEIEPPATVEAIADVYVKEIRARQPVGPYRLVGWSMGGIAAFEIARQLERAGETVASLALIDATVPTPAHCAYWRARFGDFTLADMAYVFLRNIVRSLDKTVELSPLHYAGWSADDVERDVLARLQELQIVPPETALRDVRLRLDVFRVTVRSMYDDPVSVTAKFPRDVFAFNSADGHPFMPADCPNGTWDEFVAGRVETRAVPGDHYTVCHPANAAALAAALSAALTPPPDRVR